MRNSISFKLFLALLATCIVVALAMGMATRISFESGFDDYVQERENQRLDTLAQVLAADYAEAGGWAQLLHDRRHWGRVLRITRQYQREDLSPGGKERGGDSPARTEIRVMLADAAGNWLAGARLPSQLQVRRRAVVVRGVTVGWLLAPSLLPAAINDEIDRQFQVRQLHATWMIVALSVLIAAVVSLLLARLLLVPIKRIAKATHALASGAYHSRVAVDSGDELGRLASDFNHLASSLERHEQLRRELMADLSHELRTPLAILRGEIEALQDGLRALDHAALESLAHEVAMLSKLIDDLHELSLADVGALVYDMQPLDLSALLGQGVFAVQERFQRAGLDLQAQLADDLWVVADARRLQQVVSNLLENSLRHTDAPGRVEIRLYARAGQAIIDLSDSAPGVAPEHLPRLFERLFRADSSRSRRYGGAGLGLAICNSIVAAHQGTIEALPGALGGLLLRVSLPLRP